MVQRLSKQPQTCRHVHDLDCTELHLFQCNCSWVISIKPNATFIFQPPAMFVFLVFRKRGLTDSRSCFENLSAYKPALSHADQCKFCIHLRSSNVRHIRLKIRNYKLWRQGHIQWRDLPTVFHKIYQLVQKLIGGTETRTQTGRWSRKPTFFFLLEGK
jgi:hypothetical protein